MPKCRLMRGRHGATGRAMTGLVDWMAARARMTKAEAKLAGHRDEMPEVVIDPLKLESCNWSNARGST